MTVTWGDADTDADFDTVRARRSNLSVDDVAALLRLPVSEVLATLRSLTDWDGE